MELAALKATKLSGKFASNARSRNRWLSPPPNVPTAVGCSKATVNEVCSETADLPGFGPLNRGVCLRRVLMCKLHISLLRLTLYQVTRFKRPASSSLEMAIL